MHTLHHLKDFDDLSAENENIFKLRWIFDQDMDQFIKHYDSDQWSDEQYKDFDDDGHTELHTFTDEFSGISERILSPPTVVSPKNNQSPTFYQMSNPLSPSGLIRLN